MLSCAQIHKENPDLKMNRYYEANTALMAAYTILDNFENEREQKDFAQQLVLCRGSDFSSHALRNDGRSIGAIAGLFQYKPDVAWAGLDDIMKSIDDPSVLTLEQMAYLLAVATPLYEGRGTPAMAKAFLSYATKLVDEGTLPMIDPLLVDTRFMKLDAQFVQETCRFLSYYMNDPATEKGEDLLKGAVTLAQRFLRYCPNQDNPALEFLNHNASDLDIIASAKDIKTAWLNSAKRTASYAFPEDGKPGPRWKSKLEKAGNPATRAEYIQWLVENNTWRYKNIPRVSPKNELFLQAP